MYVLVKDFNKWKSYVSQSTPLKFVSCVSLARRRTFPCLKQSVLRFQYCGNSHDCGLPVLGKGVTSSNPWTWAFHRHDNFYSKWAWDWGWTLFKWSNLVLICWTPGAACQCCHNCICGLVRPHSLDNTFCGAVTNLLRFVTLNVVSNAPIPVYKTSPRQALSQLFRSQCLYLWNVGEHFNSILWKGRSTMEVWRESRFVDVMSISIPFCTVVFKLH